MELTVYAKDSTKDMSELASNSIDLIITSPPYWDLKDYKHPCQLGFGMLYDEYISGLKSNLLECMRVMKEDSLAAFIVGDVRSKPLEKGPSKDTRPRMFSIQSDIINIFIQNGFELFEHFIWKKASVKKGKKRFIIYGAAQKGCVYPPYLYGDLAIEHILIFHKHGMKRKLPKLVKRTFDRIPREEAEKWLDSVWEIPPAKSHKHPAIFPNELVDRLLKLYSLENYKVLDPFCGVGTTLERAILLNRNAIGYELNCNDYLIELIDKYHLVNEGVKYFTESDIEAISEY